MQVQVKLIATYRKYLPQKCQGNLIDVEVPPGSTPFDILAQFNVPTGAASVILVNGRAPEKQYTLQEGDVVCAFPAIAGG